ncbi:sigma factor [Pedobacter aquatilis]|uniref:sigma factor n=1 Tax=Pedobacter aquatilis TaxID=351343 RepID=UPI00292FC84F|nr:sigma factor [Pedobacter aquatilis]
MQPKIIIRQAPEKPFFKVFSTPDNICPIKLKERDRKTFKALYRVYAPMIYGSLMRSIKDEQKCNMLLEQVFLIAWQDISLYDESKCKLHTWLNRIAKKEVL